MTKEDRRILVEDTEDDDLQEREQLQGSRSRGSLLCCSNLVYLSSAIAAIGGVLFGYDVGVIAGAKVQVAHQLGLSCGQEEALVSFMPLGALSASLVAGNIINRFGRKWAIQLTAVAFTVGSLVMATASSLPVLLLGRFVVGFAVSLSAMSECLYISEISKSSNRGMLVSLNELGITVGFLLAFLVNYMFVDMTDGWRYMFGLSSAMSIVQLVAMCYLPRTPHFLLLHSRDTEAAAVLQQIHPGGQVKQEMANIRLSVETAMRSSCSQLFSYEENMLRRTMIGITLVIFLQVTGQPNILYYATDIFQAVGFCGDTPAAMATIGLGIVKVAVTVVSLMLVDKVGRRTLLLVGATCMTVCLLVLTVFAGYQYTAVGYHHRETCSHAPAQIPPPDFNNLSTSQAQHLDAPQHNSIIKDLTNTSDHIHKNPFSHVQHVGGNQTTTDLCEADDSLPFGLRYVAFIALVLYVAAFSFSFGPVTWILLTELFPVNLKGEAMSLGQAVSWTANVFVSVTFLDAVRVMTLPFVFFVYLAFSVASIFFIHICIPETKGKSLEQISEELKGKRRSKSPRSASWSPSITADFTKLQDSPF